MSFPRYPKYKASGVEWLGEVPDGWEVKRARAVGVFSSSGIDKKSVDGEQAVQMFNYLDVYKSPDKILRYSEDLMWTTAPASKVAEHSVVLDDILLTPSSETADDIGHAARVTSVPPNILYSYHILRFRKGVGFDASFVTHCFNAVPIRSYFESVCTGTTRKVLVRDDFKNAPFAIPPLPEQTAIAEFLDRETGKIDELVAEQRRLMELLKEKRQAVISHAVTKGLNPHAPMKPSGIEWLGDVPVGWAVKPLRWASKCYSGDGISSDEIKPTDDDAHSIRVIGGNGLMGYTAHGNIKRPVLAVGRVGALCGNIHIVAPPAWITDNALVLDSDSDVFDLQFLSFVMRIRNLNDIASRTAQPLITGTQVRDQRIPAPPLKEQQQITAFLSQELAKFDTLTAEAQRAIDLLQERRTALISAAVTGQIDVRHQPSN